MKKFWDPKFFAVVLSIAVPIMVQNAVTNFVALLDNIMIGQLGTEQMSGVSIINQLLFVFNLTLFGAVSGSGIFTSQFHGSANQEGICQTFRYKLLLAAIIFLASIGIFHFFDTQLIGAWLHQSESEGDLAMTMASARDYLRIMLWGLLFYAIKDVYASTLRETGQAVLPMIAGLVAVVVNLGLNYLLIFGKLGCPPLGIRGGAIATVASRVVECVIVVLWTHLNPKKNPYISGVYRSVYIQPQLAKEITCKGMPLMFNELLWAAAIATLSRCYAQRGLDVVAGYNIASAVVELAAVVYMAIGNGTAIVLGQILGSGKKAQARSSVPKLVFLAGTICAGVGLVQVGLSGVIPLLYQTTDQIRGIASTFIILYGCFQPIYAISTVEYFTLRSGGQILITFLFDSIFCWVVVVPTAALLIWGTALPATSVYLVVQFTELLKAVLGFFYVKRGSWLHNLVQNY